MPHHVHHPAPLVVGVAVEQVNGLVPATRGDGPLVAMRLGEVRVGVVSQLEVGLVTTLGVLAPHVLEVGGEAFVQFCLGFLVVGFVVVSFLVCLFVCVL